MLTKKEKIETLESKLYENVEKFFEKEKNCEKTGSAVNRSISLRIFGGIIYPDVFGVSEPAGRDFQVYMAEGNKDLKEETLMFVRVRQFLFKDLRIMYICSFPRYLGLNWMKKRKMMLRQSAKNLILVF